MAPYSQPTRRNPGPGPGPSTELSNQAGRYGRPEGFQSQRNGTGYQQPRPDSSTSYDYSHEDGSDQPQPQPQPRAQRYGDINSAPSSSRTTYIPPSQRVPLYGHSGTQSHSAPSPRRRYIPESATLFLAGDSFVGALSPAKGPQPREIPTERGESEVEKEEYAVLKKEWEVYDAIPKMIKIRKEKGAAAKVGFEGDW
jgi:hypothetical protein